MTPVAASDSALLLEYAEAGTDDACRQIVERYTPLVFGTCRRIPGEADQVEDAAQGTFVALALKAAQIDAGRGLGGWLHRVARQVSLDMHKAARRRMAREQEAWRRADSSVLESSRPVGAMATGLDAAIDQLPAKLRLAVIQHYFEGMSLEAIAVRQGCTPSAISMRLTRARSTLRKLLKRQGLAVASLFDGEVVVPAAVAGSFTHAAVRMTAAALKGGAAAEPFAAHAVAVARQALRRLLLWWLRRGLAGGAAVAVGLAVAAVIRSQAVPADAAPIPSTPETVLPVPLQEAARLSAAPAVPARSARAVPDSKLIAELKKPLPFETLPAFKTLLDAMASSLDAARDADGRTALHWAARGGNEEPALLLLLRGASPNAPDAAGRTPLFDAIERGGKWMTLLFILAKADVNHRANDGSSPLSLAVRKGDLALSEWLLWLGANTHLDEAIDAAQQARLARMNGNSAMERLFDDYDALRRRTFASSRVRCQCSSRTDSKTRHGEATSCGWTNCSARSWTSTPQTTRAGLPCTRPSARSSLTWCFISCCWWQIPTQRTTRVGAR